jgi:hypothetical protein
LGTVGTITGLLALLVSYRSYKANARMAAVNESMARTNQRLATANEEIAASSERAAEAARAMVNVQGESERAKQRAILVLPGPPRSPIGYSRTGETGTLNLALRNEGQARAYDVLVSGTRETPGRNDHPVSLPASSIGPIEPGKERECSIRINEQSFGDFAERDFAFVITFRDGLGPGKVDYRVRVWSYWSDSWSSQTVEET